MIKIHPTFKLKECNVTERVYNKVVESESLFFDFPNTFLVQSIEENIPFFYFLYYFIDIIEWMLVVVKDEKEQERWKVEHGHFVGKHEVPTFILIVTLDELWSNFPMKNFFETKSPLVKADRDAVIQLKHKSYTHNSPVGQINSIPLLETGNNLPYYTTQWDVVVIADPGSFVDKWPYLYAVNGLSCKHKMVVNDNPMYSETRHTSYFRQLYFLAVKNAFDGDGPVTSPNWCKNFSPIPMVRQMKIERIYKFVVFGAMGESVRVRTISLEEELAEQRRLKRLKYKKKRPKTVATGTDELPMPKYTVRLRTLTLRYNQGIVNYVKGQRELTPTEFYNNEKVMMTKLADFKNHLHRYAQDPHTLVLCRFGVIDQISQSLGGFPEERLVDDVPQEGTVNRLFLLDPMLEYEPEVLTRMITLVRDEIVVVAYHDINEDRAYGTLFQLINDHVQNVAYPVISTITPVLVSTRDDGEIFNHVAEYKHFMTITGKRTTALKLQSQVVYVDTHLPIYGFNDDPNRHLTIYDAAFSLFDYISQVINDAVSENTKEIRERYYDRILHDIGEANFHKVYYNDQQWCIDGLVKKYLKPNCHHKETERFRVFEKWLLPGVPVEEGRALFMLKKEIKRIPSWYMWDRGQMRRHDPALKRHPNKYEVTEARKKLQIVHDIIYSQRYCLTLYEVSEYGKPCTVSRQPYKFRLARVESFRVDDPPPLTIKKIVTLDTTLLVLAVSLGLVCNNELLNSEFTFDELIQEGDYRTTLYLIYTLMNPFERFIATKGNATIIYQSSSIVNGIVGATEADNLPFDELTSWLYQLYTPKTKMCVIDYAPSFILADLARWCTVNHMELKVTKTEGLYFLSETTLFVRIELLALQMNNLFAGKTL